MGGEVGVAGDGQCAKGEGDMTESGYIVEWTAWDGVLREVFFQSLDAANGAAAVYVDVGYQVAIRKSRVRINRRSVREIWAKQR